MKKVLSIILSICMLLSITAGLNLSAFADDLPSSGSCGENVNYTFDSSSGTLTISGTGPMTDYGYGDSPFDSQYDSIKNVIINSGVSSISDYAFCDCWSLTSITIPNSVTSIGEEAFRFCTSLTSATIPERVTSIGENAFVNCKSLISISVDSDNVYYFSQDGVLFNKEKTELIQYPIGNSRTEYEIPYSVISIGDDAFRFCESITSVSIPNSVTSIGRCAFDGCNGLKSVTLPNSVRSIDFYAFSSCDSLTSVIIPESVTSIDDSAFSFCKSLIGITVDSDNTYYFSEDGVLFNKEKTKLIQYPIGNSRTSYIIPNSVTSIGSVAFYSCHSLTSITIPDSVKYIEDNTFAWCISLTSIYIPHSVTSIDYDAFVNCESLTDVYYSGTEADWNKIKIGNNNDDLLNASIHYGSEMPEEVVVLEGENTGRFYSNGEAITNNSVDINPQIDSSWFFDDSITYNHNIAKLCAVLDLEGYQKKSDVKSALKSLGFVVKDKDIQLKTERDEVNYFIAYIPVKKGEEIYNLVFMGLIGSHKLQWNSNFDPAGKESSKSGFDVNTQVHLGFNDAKDFAAEKLKDYFDENKSFTKDNTKILLTGHSRGAAAANLLAADLIYADELRPSTGFMTELASVVAPKNLFTYTFATPNNTKDRNRKTYDYQRIFNIVFPNDLVPHLLPVAWKFGKYGTTYTIPTKTSSSKNYSKYVENMLPYYKAWNTKTIKNSEQSADQRKIFEDFKKESKPARAINKLTKQVNSLNEFYSVEYNCGKKWRWYGNNAIPVTRWITPFEYFQKGLCPFVNKVDDEDFALMLSPALDNFSPYQGICLFFAKHNNERVSTQLFEDSHKMETYAAFMYSLNEDVLKKPKNHTLNCVYCPVDIEVYDKDTDEIVGKIINNEVDEEIDNKDNSIDMYVENDEKFFYIPDDGNYEVRFIGNDNGKMDYSVQEIDSDLGEVCRSNFYDVELKKGEAYTGEFDAETFDIDSYSITDENGKEIQADERFDSENTIEYTVNVNTEGSGEATNSLTVTSGDYVTLYAETICSDFIGWYNGDELVSTETTYRFRPSDNVEYTAKFTEAIHHSFNNSVTSPTCTEKGYTNYECAVCGYSYKDNYTNALGHDFGNNGKQCKRCKITNPNYKEPVTKKVAKTVRKVNLEKVKGLKVKASKKKIKVLWKKVSGVDGYQIQYGLKKNFKKAKKKTVKSAKKTKVTIKKLKSKKKYFVRIRTYKVVNGKKVYSKWSKAKKVKVK